MPSNKEHWRHSFKRYKVMAEDIHTWMHEPCVLYGTSHRKVRHDFNQEIPLEFIEKYGEELARNIMIDHIRMDLKGGELSKEDVKEIRYRKKKQKSKFDELIIDLDKKGRETDFDTVWSRITNHSGNTFQTITQREFTYKVKEDLIWLNKGKYPITKDEVKKACDMLPFNRPSDISHITRGSSYLWSLLHDDRIVVGENAFVNRETSVETNTNHIQQSQILIQETPQRQKAKAETKETVQRKCQTCAWVRYLKKTQNKKGLLGLLTENVYTISKPNYANRKDVDLYCTVLSGVDLFKVVKIKHFTDEEVNKIGFFSSPCNQWISKNEITL